MHLHRPRRGLPGVLVEARQSWVAARLAGPDGGAMSAGCRCDSCAHKSGQSCRHGWLAAHCPWRQNERAPMGACGKGETK